MFLWEPLIRRLFQVWMHVTLQLVRLGLYSTKGARTYERYGYGKRNLLTQDEKPKDQTLVN